MDTAAGRRGGRGLILVRLRGGLGNQLFQYALGRHLSIIHDRPLLLDTSEYRAAGPDPRKGIRVYCLQHFNIRAGIAGPDETAPFRRYYRPDLLSRVLRRAGGLGFVYGHTYVYRSFRQAHVHYPRVLERRPRGVYYLDGYWQLERYFAASESILREELVLGEAPDDYNRRMLERIDAAESVCVHIRHGDNAYGYSPQHGVLPPDYYARAIDDLARAVPDPRFFVFSDDPEWARENVRPGGDTTYVDGNGDERNYEDLRLMGRCRHHITANSTFSWWGAWLGRRPGQRVYAPGRYFMHLEVPIGGYYPESWNIIDV
ncbi:MAG: alpha-1,2-fucosyltransferase [Acidobacteria bacterium]|nr:alpha-1,2-fucosyltransferase [Acidobacteriota bacterium]